MKRSPLRLVAAGLALGGASLLAQGQEVRVPAPAAEIPASGAVHAPGSPARETLPPEPLPEPLPFKEETAGNYRAGGIKVEGAFAGTPLTVDAAFTTHHDNSPPTADFRVIVPRVKNLLFLPGGKKSGLPELVKLTLSTDDRQKAVEILRLTQLTVPTGPVEERLAKTARLLTTQAAGLITNGYENPRQLDLYATKVGDCDAVSLHLEMTKPGTHEVYLVKAIAILHPTTEGGVLAFLMADKELSDVKEPDDLLGKGVSLRIIHSLKFIDGLPRE